MKNLFKIIFIFFIFLAGAFIGTHCCGASGENAGNAVLVSNYDYKDMDIIDAENFANANISRSAQKFQSAKRVETNFSSSFFSSKRCNFDVISKIVSYIYSKAYLDKIKSNNLYLLTLNINPNAP